MEIVKNIPTPTGNILVVKGERGLIECLSLGDYGASKNVKADFLGLFDEPKVEHGPLLPLEEKWVITISTQYGCSCNCKFCDVPKVPFSGGATQKDLIDQFFTAKGLHPEVKKGRINLHYARMGEPMYNYINVCDSACMIKEHKEMKNFKFHPVISTMLPQYKSTLKEHLEDWIRYKEIYLDNDAGLQLSINSTNPDQRRQMFNGLSFDKIDDIGKLVENLPIPIGRKYTLNFAIADWEIDPKILIRNFPVEKFICKLTPMHKTSTALANDIKTVGDYTTFYPYQEIEKKLKDVGYDVLVFIASREEDESLITCGNAVLASMLNKEKKKSN